MGLDELHKGGKQQSRCIEARPFGSGMVGPCTFGYSRPDIGALHYAQQETVVSKPGETVEKRLLATVTRA